MDLSFDDEWVEHRSDIIDGMIGGEFDLAAFPVDFDFGNMAAAGKGEIRRIVEGRLFEPRFERFERIEIGRVIGGKGNFAEALATVGADDANGSISEQNLASAAVSRSNLFDLASAAGVIITIS